MTHDPTKVVLGVTLSNHKVVSPYSGAASTFAAGLAVRQKSDGTLSLAKADGELLGISLGDSLDGAGRVSVCRAGLRVALQVTAAFTPTKGAQVNISDTTGKAAAAGAGATGVNAIYVSGLLKGINHVDKSEVDVVLIDMQGGL